MATKVKTINRNGLVGEWLLNGSALDTSGNGYNGTATNVTYTNTDKGYQSQTGVFNGTNAQITNSFTSVGLTAMSICVWFKTPNSTQTGWRDIITVPYTDGQTTYGLFINNGGNLVWYNAISGPSTIGDLGSQYSDGLWHLFVGVNDGSTRKGYIDGVLKCSDNGGNPQKNSLAIGFDGAGSFWNGQIQTVRIYNRAIDTNEIQTLYQEGLRQLSGQSYGTLFDGLVASYDFNGDANDIVGGNNGTVTGATLTTDHLGTANHAYSFGATNYISGSGINIANSDFTFEYYGKQTTSSSIYDLFSIGDLSGGTRQQAYLRIGQYNGSISLGFYNDDWIITQPITVGTYYHIVGTFNNTTKVGEFFINGVSIGTHTFGGAFIGGTNYMINGTVWTSSNIYGGIGTIDYIKVYKSRKTADEVLQLYQLSSTRYLQPIAKTLPKNLQQGLIFYSNGQEKELTGTYPLTTVGTPTKTRIQQAKQTSGFSTGNYYYHPTFLDSGLSAWTAFTWIKSSSTTAANIFTKADSGLLYPIYLMTNSGYAQIYWNPQSVFGANVLLGTTNICDGKWHLVIISGDSSGRNSMKLMIDGNYEGTLTSTTGGDAANIPANSVYDFHIGNSSETNANPWLGNIGEIGFYNRILSDTEKKQLYLSTFIK